LKSAESTFGAAQTKNGMEDGTKAVMGQANIIPPVQHRLLKH